MEQVNADQRKFVGNKKKTYTLS